MPSLQPRASVRASVVRFLVVTEVETARGHSHSLPRISSSSRRSCPTPIMPRPPDIPGLRDDPKIVGRDDTKVVGDSVAKAVPFFGNSSPKEAQDCRSELGEGFIASIIGDMFVHYAPASFDRIKMRTIGRDEVQPDPASRLPQPLTHQNRVVVGGVVKKDVDPFLSRIGGFDGDQQCDQAHRVNLRGLQHLRLPGLQIDRAMDVQALAPGGLLDPNGHVLRRPTSCRPRLMRGMYRINEHDRFIGFEAVQKLLVARDESLLLRFVKLARHALRLVIDKTKPMQQCDQPRVAIAKLIILPKPGPNRIRAAGQPRRDKGFQSRLLLVRQLARTAFMAEIPQSRHALPLIDLEPLAHRVVVQQKRRPDLLAVPAVVQKNNRVRPPRHPVLHKAIPRDRYQCASLRCGQKSRANHQPHPNPPGPRCQPTASRVFVESRYIREFSREFFEKRASKAISASNQRANSKACTEGSELGHYPFPPRKWLCRVLSRRRRPHRRHRLSQAAQWRSEQVS